MWQTAWFGRHSNPANDAGSLVAVHHGGCKGYYPPPPLPACLIPPYHKNEEISFKNSLTYFDHRSYSIWKQRKITTKKCSFELWTKFCKIANAVVVLTKWLRGRRVHRKPTEAWLAISLYGESQKSLYVSLSLHLTIWSDSDPAKKCIFLHARKIVTVCPKSSFPYSSRLLWKLDKTPWTYD